MSPGTEVTPDITERMRGASEGDRGAASGNSAACEGSGNADIRLNHTGDDAIYAPKSRDGRKMTLSVLKHASEPRFFYAMIASPVGRGHNRA